MEIKFHDFVQKILEKRSINEIKTQTSNIFESPDILDFYSEKERVNFLNQLGNHFKDNVTKPTSISELVQLTTLDELFSNKSED